MILSFTSPANTIVVCTVFLTRNIDLKSYHPSAIYIVCENVPNIRKRNIKSFHPVS